MSKTYQERLSDIFWALKGIRNSQKSMRPYNIGAAERHIADLYCWNTTHPNQQMINRHVDRLYGILDRVIRSSAPG